MILLKNSPTKDIMSQYILYYQDINDNYKLYGQYIEYIYGKIRYKGNLFNGLMIGKWFDGKNYLYEYFL